MSPVDTADVIIIGAGLAGLTAAVGLLDHGLKVVVLEREPLLGGRASSWTDRVTGDPVSIGPHVLLNQYLNMLKLLDRLGTRNRVVWQPDRRFITMVDARREIVIRNSGLPAPYHFVPGLMSDPRLSWRDLVSNWPVVKLAFELDEVRLLRLDSLTALEFLRSMGVSQRFIERFWAFAAFAIMNTPLELASAAALMRFYRRLVCHPDLALGFPDRGLGDLYAPQIRALIEQSGGAVITQAEVNELIVTGAQVTGVRLADGQRLSARYYLAALPPQALRLLIPPQWLRHEVFRNLHHFDPIPYISVCLWFDRKLTKRQFWARCYSPHDLNCDFYDLSNINADWNRRASVIASNIINSHRAASLSDAQIVQTTLGEIADFLPQTKQARVLHAVINRIPLAVPAPRPGSEARRTSVHTPISGLFIAGDWLKTGIPYSMESATASGWLAAEAILAETGKFTTLAVEHPSLTRQHPLVHWTGKLLPDPAHPY